MNNTSDIALVDWLLANAGPIIRYRLVKDFALSVSRKELTELREAVLATDQVRQWLDNLGHKAIHGSEDKHAENAMGKLIEFGLRAGLPELDDKVFAYIEELKKQPPSWITSDIIMPFFIAAGYADNHVVKKWFMDRLQILHKTACKRDYDLYMPEKEADKLPKAWRGKKVYRPEFYCSNRPQLPSCYDLYALAHWPHTKQTMGKVDAIVDYISQPEFQDTPGGYFWNEDKRRCYAAGRVWLACFEPYRKMLFLELFARFESAREKSWFQDAVSQLEAYRTDEGTYGFPADLLREKQGYYLYGGSRMGLGENRRKRNWREWESTFRMLNIRRLMKL